MNLNEWASLIAEEEGKKSQVSIGNIREILRIIRKHLTDPKMGMVVLRLLLRN